jgi:hypothetical protein
VSRPIFYITAALCFVAMLPGMPYGFFMLLRLCVCGVSIYGALHLFERKSERLAWGCVALAVVFNPIFKIHLGREVWWFADGVAGVFLCVVAFKGAPSRP